MILKKSIKSLVVGLVMLQASSVLGQLPQEGYYEISTELQGVVTESMHDSVLAISETRPNTWSHIDYDSLGSMVWRGSTWVNYLPNDSTKVNIIFYYCYENGWEQLKGQFDLITDTKDYDDIHTASYELSGSVFWSENIDVELVDSTEIIINSPVDVNTKIYKEYAHYQPEVEEFSIIGNGTNKSISIDLEDNNKYIIVFINNDNVIVNIQRIGG